MSVAGSELRVLTCGNFMFDGIRKFAYVQEGVANLFLKNANY